MTTPPIKLVLDTTAITAYAHGSVPVGELVAEVTDEHGAFAVPVLCLVEAGAVLDMDDWATVDVLLRHPQCVLVDWPGGWRDVSATARSLGSVGRAVAVLWAVARDAYLVTAEPGVYGDADFVLGI